MRITGELAGTNHKLGEDEKVIGNENLKGILEYIDNASMLIPLKNVRNPQNPQESKAVLIGHASPGLSGEILKVARETGKAPHYVKIQKDILCIREADYANHPQNPIELAGIAGFYEFVHGHDPVEKEQKIKRELHSCNGGNCQIWVTNIDGGMYQRGGIENQRAVANLYDINTGRAFQFTRDGEKRTEVDLTVDGAR